ncbi:MAG: prephenate dehydratase [Chlamydiae bacterium]|nr:prephenate dehydratase [Chlamydiota bacterium]MBI3265976.1 prephenate dehydratase [Chlamydiota bacterium]
MNLKKLRSKIDCIDRKLVALIHERTQLALDIGHQKIKQGQNIYSPEREMNVYENILAHTKDSLLPRGSLKAIFREIMSAALAVEKGLRVAYLGPMATFTHQASIQKFGASVEYVPLENISDVFFEVEKGRADYGVVPIENSTDGAVTHTLDMFIDSDLKICSEVLLKINHSLLSNSSLNQIKKVYSKPEVFGQCRLWLKEHLPHADQISASSTSRAAEVASKEKGAAALASSLAAQYYPIRIQREGVEDFQTNVTRFLIVGTHAAKRTGRDKTSILFSVRDKVGALYEMLVPFKKHHINLTKIESRPSKKKAWEYYFYIDLIGHQDDAHVKSALKSLEKHCHFLKILGSYPFNK